MLLEKAANIGISQDVCINDLGMSHLTRSSLSRRVMYPVFCLPKLHLSQSFLHLKSCHPWKSWSRGFKLQDEASIMQFSCPEGRKKTAAVQLLCSFVLQKLFNLIVVLTVFRYQFKILWPCSCVLSEASGNLSSKNKYCVIFTLIATFLISRLQWKYHSWHWFTRATTICLWGWVTKYFYYR